MRTHQLHGVRRWTACVVGVSVVSLVLPAPAWAWGRDGHRIVGRIAEARLTPAAREAIAKLLGEDKRLSDDEVANWADKIRNEFPETGPWHYVDIPVEEGKYDPARDCKYSDCVIDRIEMFREVLANKEVKPAERVRALKFLVHLVGDLHQPLHCAERKDSSGRRDQGGNLCFVRFLDEPDLINLHRVWDYKIIERALTGSDPLAYAEKLDAKIAGDAASRWRGGSAKQWAVESFETAVKHVYAGVAPDGEPTPLDHTYVDNGQKLIDEQLAKAGIRLAEILNRTLH